MWPHWLQESRTERWAGLKGVQGTSDGVQVYAGRGVRRQALGGEPTRRDPDLKGSPLLLGVTYSGAIVCLQILSWTVLLER